MASLAFFIDLMGLSSTRGERPRVPFTSIKGFVLPYNIAPYKVQIIYNENNKVEAEELYNYLLENNITSILDDRENLSIGNRINDVYVLGTPKMIILGNKFDGNNYIIEDTKTNEKASVIFENILDELKK